MTGFWRDPTFQQKLVTFLCRDRNILKRVAHKLKPKDFEPRRGQGPEWHFIAELALDFYHKYKEPVAGMLRTEALDIIHQKKIEGRTREQLLKAVDKVNRADKLVAVEAIEQKVDDYLRRRVRQKAIQDILEEEEEGTLTNERLAQITNRVLKYTSQQYTVTDYFAGLDQRLVRRRLESSRKWPVLFIDPLDERMRVLSRGNLGMALAQYKVGKSVFLAWVSYAYMIQGLNVLYVTLEDHKEEVEDRFDSLYSRIALKELAGKGSELKEKFQRALDLTRGRLRIVDGTEGGVSVALIESIFDQQRNQGFTADAVVVDYDDEIEPPRRFAADKNARRHEFADIYRELRRFAAKRDLYVWTAAQAVRGKEDQKIIAGKDAAEDISKIRKVAFCVGIGRDTEYGRNGRYLYIAAHRHDESRVGFSIVGDFKTSVFYDDDETKTVAAAVAEKRAKEKGAEK
jgi:replicative DNA helicase